MTAHVLTDLPAHGGTTVPLAWDDLARRVAEADLYWLSCTGRDGVPHTRPVLGAWVDGAFHCCIGPGTAKGRILARDPRCSVALQAPDLDAVLAGRMERVRGTADLRAVAAAYDDKYGWVVQVRDEAFWADGAPTAGPPPFHVLRLDPDAVHAFPTSDGLSGGSTRWRFG